MKKEKTPKHKIIAFDFDGTIVDSFDVVLKIWQDLARKHKFNVVDAKQLKNMYQYNFFEMVDEVLGISKLKVLLLSFKIKKMFIRQFDDIDIFDKMDEVLRKLSEKATVIIVTSNFNKVVREYLKHHNLQGYVHKVMGAESAFSKVKKFKRIIKKYPDSEFYYVADTSGDVREAKTAGFKTIAVSWGYQEEKGLKLAKPDVIARKPKELLKLI